MAQAISPSYPVLLPPRGAPEVESRLLKIPPQRPHPVAAFLPRILISLLLGTIGVIYPPLWLGCLALALLVCASGLQDGDLAPDLIALLATVLTVTVGELFVWRYGHVPSALWYMPIAFGAGTLAQIGLSTTAWLMHQHRPDENPPTRMPLYRLAGTYPLFIMVPLDARPGAAYTYAYNTYTHNGEMFLVVSARVVAPERGLRADLRLIRGNGSQSVQPLQTPLDEIMSLPARWSYLSLMQNGASNLRWLSRYLHGQRSGYPAGHQFSGMPHRLAGRGATDITGSVSLIRSIVTLPTISHQGAYPLALTRYPVQQSLLVDEATDAIFTLPHSLRGRRWQVSSMEMEKWRPPVVDATSPTALTPVEETKKWLGVADVTVDPQAVARWTGVTPKEVEQVSRWVGVQDIDRKSVIDSALAAAKWIGVKDVTKQDIWNSLEQLFAWLGVPELLPFSEAQKQEQRALAPIARPKPQMPKRSSAFVIIREVSEDDSWLLPLPEASWLLDAPEGEIGNDEEQGYTRYVASHTVAFQDADKAIISRTQSIFATFDRFWADELLTRQARPWITFTYPQDTAGDLDALAATLHAISHGEFDASLWRWARDIRAFRYPVYLTLLPDIDRCQIDLTNLDTVHLAREVIRAWLHVQSIFSRSGARNIAWVWSPRGVSMSIPRPLALPAPARAINATPTP